MADLLDQIFRLISSQPVNPQVPPPRQGRFVSNLGPTIDELVNRLPEDHQAVYRRYALGLDPTLPAQVRGETQRQAGIRLNPNILGDPVRPLYGTLAHEATHKLQDDRPDLVTAPNSGWWLSPSAREEEAYATAQSLSEQLVKLFGLDWTSRSLGDRRARINHR